MRKFKTKLVRIVGMDLSLNHCGFVELVNGKLDRFFYVTKNAKCLQAGKLEGRGIPFPKLIEDETRTVQRLKWWTLCFEHIVYGLNPDYVGIENYAFSAKHGAHQSGEQGGLIRLLLLEKKIPFRLIDPLSVKMFATLSGSVDTKKSDVKKAVREYWGVDFDKYDVGYKSMPPSEDLCDAYTLAKMVWYEYQLRNGMIDISTLHPKRIQVFNRVTKAEPINILARDWLVLPVNYNPNAYAFPKIAESLYVEE